MNEGFKKEDGPFVRAIEAALNKIGVKRQAYYSGSFVGNHVHTALRVSIPINIHLVPCVHTFS